MESLPEVPAAAGSSERVSAREWQSDDAFDPHVPNIARVYDYWLGGKDNFAADRELAGRLLDLYPPVAEMARDNRRFLARAVAWVAEQGIAQFIDLGAGLPTKPNTHEAAMGANPAARVAYVDNDPVVVSHCSALLARDDGAVIAMAADLREPEMLLADAGLRTLTDLSSPACLIFGQVLHFLSPGAARELMAKYVAALAPGSFVIISIGRGDGEVADRFFSAYNAAKLYNHSAEDFATFFTGMEIVPPGLAEAAAWLPGQAAPTPPARRPGQVLAGVGRVGGRS